MASSAGAALMLGLGVLLFALGPSPVQAGSRNLLQLGANLVISVPSGISYGGLGFPTPTPSSVELGFKTTFVFLITNTGDAPTPTANVSIRINDLYTFSLPNTTPYPPVTVTISSDGHSVNAVYNAPNAPLNPGKQEISFDAIVTATAVGPQAIPFGLTGSAVPGGSPYRAITPAVIPTTQGVCGTPGPAGDFPTRCFFKNADINTVNGRYVCCDAQGCDGFNADDFTPHCKNSGYNPPAPTPAPTTYPPDQSSGDEGVCGSGAAQYFPIRCWFNADKLERYVCCDNKGCNGFDSDNLTPKCVAAGFVPPAGSPIFNPAPGVPATVEPPSGQGVCGTRAALYFPNRCWYNNDPQGRYVCCDSDGCNGFNSDNLTPHCKIAGFVPLSNN